MHTTYIRKEDCPCPLATRLKPFLTPHLTILRQAGLIEDRKSGKYIYYELNTTVFQEVLSWIQTLMEADNHEEDK